MSNARKGIRPMSLSRVTRLVVVLCFFRRKLVTDFQRHFNCAIAFTTFRLLPLMVDLLDTIISATKDRSGSTVHGVSLGRLPAAVVSAAEKCSSGERPKLTTGGRAVLCEQKLLTECPGHLLLGELSACPATEGAVTGPRPLLYQISNWHMPRKEGRL